MSALQSLLQAHAPLALMLGGLSIGFVFGYLASRTNFCVMGAISDWRTFASGGRLGAVALAAAVAIGGAQTLDVSGFTDLSRSMYLAPRLNVLGAVCGGLLFGFGMVYAGGCASRNLIRAGGGDVRALTVVLVLSVAAFATISGVLGPLRVALEDATAFETSNALAGIPGAISLAGGWSGSGARGLAAALLIVPLIGFAVIRGGVLRDSQNLAAGLGIGAMITAGWMLTGLTRDDMALSPVPPASLSFVRPVADAIDWLERATAMGLPGFGASTVFGTLLGSFAATAAARRLRVTGFADRTDVLRHLGGAVAMGVGGVFALGCSIGQGLTGVSTLSVQSLIAAAAIFAGAWAALARLERAL